MLMSCDNVRPFLHWSLGFTALNSAVHVTQIIQSQLILTHCNVWQVTGCHVCYNLVGLISSLHHCMPCNLFQNTDHTMFLKLNVQLTICNVTEQNSIPLFGGALTSIIREQVLAHAVLRWNSRVIKQYYYHRELFIHVIQHQFLLLYVFHLHYVCRSEIFFSQL